MSVKFQATIYQYGTNPRVDVPEETSAVFGDRGYISVRGTMNDKGVRGTLVPVTGGRHVLYVNRQMSDRAGVGVGDSVELVLDRDLEQRKPIPQELAEVLDADPAVKRAWEGTTPSHRKRIIAYLTWFANSKTRGRKVEKVVRDLKRSQPAR